MYRARRIATLLLSIAFICMSPVSRSIAQSSGSRGGIGGLGVPRAPDHDQTFETLDREAAERYIAIEGSAELRVPPTDIRVVLAITSEAKTASECREQIEQQVNALKEAWGKLQIGPEQVVVDFIAILPRYEWAFVDEGGREKAVEQLTGFRMQTNIHLAVKKESTAQLAIAEAFSLEITDIIAFDYWSDAVDEAKVQAQDQALQAAQRKAQQLLGKLIDDELPVINMQEQTVVLQPKSFYESFVNVSADVLERPSRRDLPMVRAYRPQNTYYRGPQVEVDVQSRRMPMNPEISVVSRVRLYFESPAAERARSDERKKEAGNQ